MKLTSHLPPAERDRVEGRLHSNLIAWLTTVRRDGQPVTVPVWFLLRDDETILLYSRPEKEKLRNIAANPKVSFALDVTDIGRNIVRLEGTARRAHDQPPANDHPAYLAKYTERLGAMFGTPNSSPRSSRPRSSSRRPNCIPESPRRGPAEYDGQPMSRWWRSQARHRGAGFRHTAGWGQKRMICVPGPTPYEQGSTAHTRPAARRVRGGDNAE